MNNLKITMIQYDNFAKDDDKLLTAVIRAGIDLALSDASCESFMREPFSRIAELEQQVAFLTGELQAAIATIEKVREIMRTEPGYDVEDHALVLRMMADAFAKLQQQHEPQTLTGVAAWLPHQRQGKTS